MTVSENVPLKSKKRVLTPTQQQLPNFALGAAGERQALTHLQAKGYRVLDTNLSFNNREIDIIAWDPGTQEVVFVEVKTRGSDLYGHASQAVDHRKLHKLTQLAQRYLAHRQLDHDFRFDIITITNGKLEHFENVTWLR